MAMELGVYKSSMEKYFKGQNYCVVGNKFWKKLRNDDNLESIYIIEKNQSKLTEEYYSFIKKIYMQDNYPKLFESDYLEGFCTLYQVLKERKINKKKILLTCRNSIAELKNIGLDFWDLHSKNVMINDIDETKLVDLCGAVSDPEKQDFDFQDFRMTELVLECYLFYDFLGDLRYTETLLQVSDLSYYFSNSLMKHLMAVNKFEKGLLSLEDYIDEFEDEEKMEEIRLELSKLYN